MINLVRKVTPSSCTFHHTFAICISLFIIFVAIAIFSAQATQVSDWTGLFL